MAERLAGVQGRLPHGVQPQMGPISSIMGEIMLVAVTGRRSRPWQLREIADFVIRPQILTIPGVAQVIPIGGEVRQYRIAPDPVMMSRLEIPLAELEAAVRRFGVNTGGGFVDQHAREYLIRNIGLTDRIEDLRNLVVATRQGHGILLRQVAQVDFAPRVKRGDAGYMGNPAVIVGIQKQPTADTVTLTRAIEAQLDSIQRTLPQGITANKIQFRQATFIETSIANVQARAGRGGAGRRRHPLSVPHERARHRHLARRHSHLDPHHGPGLQGLRSVHQHHDARRARHRHRRAGRRCRGGGREHPAPLEGERTEAATRRRRWP